MPSIKEFLEAMQSSWPLALTVLLGASGVMVGDYFNVPQLSSLPDWTIGAAYIVAAFSAAIVLVAALRGAIRAAYSPFRKHRAKQWQMRHVEGLSDLPPDEVYILLWAFVHGRQVVAVEFFDERVKALSAKGYLTLIPGNHHSNKVPYMIPDHIWAQLKKEDLPDHAREELLRGNPFSRW